MEWKEFERIAEERKKRKNERDGTAGGGSVIGGLEERRNGKKGVAPLAELLNEEDGNGELVRPNDSLRRYARKGEGDGFKPRTRGGKRRKKKYYGGTGGAQEEYFYEKRKGGNYKNDVY